MYRSRLILGAALAAGVAATQIAAADTSPPQQRAAAAQSGLSVSPAILERTARRRASGAATVTNTTGRRLRMTIRPRPWRQARSGSVSANRRRGLAGVAANPSRFTLPPGARRTVAVTLRRMPSKRSQYGALEIVGRPTRRRRGINVVYRLISSVRFNPTARARRLRLGVGSLRVRGRSLLLGVRNRGNSIDPVGGSVRISGPGAGRSGSVSSERILPGKLVNVRLASLRGLRRGSYRASVTLRQRGRNITSATRSFRIRR